MANERGQKLCPRWIRSSLHHDDNRKRKMAFVTLKYALKLSSAYGHISNKRFVEAYAILSQCYGILGLETTRRSQFYFLDMLMSEASLKTNRLDESREKAISAKQKIEEDTRLNDEEKLYLSLYCNTLLLAGGHDFDEPDIDYRNHRWLRVRKKFLRRFPVSFPGKIPGLKY